MKPKSLSQRIANRYLNASVPDLVWGIDQIKGAATTLHDVVSVWEVRATGTPGAKDQESLADVYGQVAKASKVLQGMIKTLNQQADALQAVHAVPLPGSKQAGLKPRKLDSKTRASVTGNPNKFT